MKKMICLLILFFVIFLKCDITLAEGIYFEKSETYNLMNFDVSEWALKNAYIAHYDDNFLVVLTYYKGDDYSGHFENSFATYANGNIDNEKKVIDSSVDENDRYMNSDAYKYYVNGNNVYFLKFGKIVKADNELNDIATYESNGISYKDSYLNFYDDGVYVLINLGYSETKGIISDTGKCHIDKLNYDLEKQEELTCEDSNLENYFPKVKKMVENQIDRREC